jgi:hypothetical protein
MAQEHKAIKPGRGMDDYGDVGRQLAKGRKRAFHAAALGNCGKFWTLANDAAQAAQHDRTVINEYKGSARN